MSHIVNTSTVTPRRGESPPEGAPPTPNNLPHMGIGHDSLDVAGIHRVGGMIGTILIGVLATAAVTGGAQGLLFGGGLGLLGRQTLASLAVAAWAFCATWLIAKAVDGTVGLRADLADEREGLDLAIHGESAYDFGPDRSTPRLSPGLTRRSVAVEHPPA